MGRVGGGWLGVTLCFARCLMVVEVHASCVSNGDFAHHGFEVVLVW